MAEQPRVRDEPPASQKRSEQMSRFIDPQLAIVLTSTDCP